MPRTPLLIMTPNPAQSRPAPPKSGREVTSILIDRALQVLCYAAAAGLVLGAGYAVGTLGAAVMGGREGAGWLWVVVHSLVMLPVLGLGAGLLYFARMFWRMARGG